MSPQLISPKRSSQGQPLAPHGDGRTVHNGAEGLKVGDRVKDVWGALGTVIRIDAAAEHGLGLLTVRYDDGRVISASLVAHDYRLAER